MAMFYNIFLFLFCLSGVILIVLVLLRKSDVGGLSGAFGGMGDMAFGVKTQKHLDKLITWVALFFFLVSIMLNLPQLRSPKEVLPTDTTTTEKPVDTPQEKPVDTPTTPQEKPEESK